mmetsp:Transcript_8413/g.34162  ORF Transcript_8413/g.34162 Transcript_8413/m.34162 type:complete len:368 (+) Transcript_8413:445-1548(+)
MPSRGRTLQPRRRSARSRTRHGSRRTRRNGRDRKCPRRGRAPTPSAPRWRRAARGSPTRVLTRARARPPRSRSHSRRRCPCLQGPSWTEDGRDAAVLRNQSAASVITMGCILKRQAGWGGEKTHAAATASWTGWVSAQALRASMRAPTPLKSAPSATAPSFSASAIIATCCATSGPCIEPVSTMRRGMKSRFPLRSISLPAALIHAFIVDSSMALPSSPDSCAATTYRATSPSPSSTKALALSLAHVSSSGYARMEASSGTQSATSSMPLSTSGTQASPTGPVAASAVSSPASAQRSPMRASLSASGLSLRCSPFIQLSLALSKTAALLVTRSTPKPSMSSCTVYTSFSVPSFQPSAARKFTMASGR